MDILEYGTTGHKHLECYYEVSSLSRCDHQKRSILSYLSRNDYEVPKLQQKNIKVTINHLDSSPLYGYGYSLKEGNVYSSTFSSDEHDNFLKYYNEHSEKVNRAKSQIDSSSKFLSVDEIAVGCCEFIRNYYTSPESGLCHFESSSQWAWLIDEYFICVKDRIKFSVFQKINDHKLEKFVISQLGTSFLTVPRL